MTIALICPSNMLYMPYVINYENILRMCGAEYEILNWDRFHIEDEEHPLKYRDTKIGHQRNVLDYYGFSAFVKGKLKSNKYEKIIVFGIQMAFFLRDILNKYKGNYVFDIRDHNMIIKYFSIKRLIENSCFTVLSSPGYKEWLPESNKYIINHNTMVTSLDELKRENFIFNKRKLVIANIGAIRDYAINIEFINSLKNNSGFDIYFHGNGGTNEKIKEYLNANNINNAYLTGRYIKEDEASLYNQSDLINVLRWNDGINNKTALPNRLYNAVIYGKPIISFEGTYLAEVVKDYKLGLVLDSFDSVDKKIKDYLNDFDETGYENGRVSFFEDTIKDNAYFAVRLKEFAGVNT